MVQDETEVVEAEYLCLWLEGRYRHCCHSPDDGQAGRLQTASYGALTCK